MCSMYKPHPTNLSYKKISIILFRIKRSSQTSKKHSSSSPFNSYFISLSRYIVNSLSEMDTVQELHDQNSDHIQ